MHVVAILALDDAIPFDLATPCEVFGRARLPDGRAAYKVRVCSPTREIDAGWFTLRTSLGLRTLERASTVVVAGITTPAGTFPETVLRTLRQCAARGARVASICSGAFVLAAAGLLDGRRATTHWLLTNELAQRYPKIAVDPNVLFVDNGEVLTSAGAAAAFDLCLHMVRADYGAAVAADAARLSVMPLERAGGQAQFIVHADPAEDGGSLEPVLRWIEQNTDVVLDLGTLAKRAGMSTRTLTRRFKEQTGTTPLQYVLRARVRRAQSLLETTDESIEQISFRVGFGSALALRTTFRRVVGTTPRNYRAAFSFISRGSAAKPLGGDSIQA